MSGLGADNLHTSVLLGESIAILGADRGGTFVDATLGLGGHSEAILEASDDNRVIGIDQDGEAITLATERLQRFSDRFAAYRSNYSEVREVIGLAGTKKIDGVLADLGVSSMQLDSETRGFSFRFDAPLDMRMDADGEGPTAEELLADLPEEELARIIYEYGEERASRKIARWIVERRGTEDAIKTTTQLADLVKRAVRQSPKDKSHPATRTFQALRIAVNLELENLEKFISDSVEILNSNGVLAIISFHSLEDRIIKQAFQKYAGRCQCPPRIPICVCGAEKKVEILTRKPVIPADAELKTNLRSRSAKLRACKKI
jgi:16S rRNA (cytosine1402-N4)-methyltransferase